MEQETPRKPSEDVSNEIDLNAVRDGLLGGERIERSQPQSSNTDGSTPTPHFVNPDLHPGINLGPPLANVRLAAERRRERLASERASESRTTSHEKN
jgi:hypothetical protein